MNKIICFGDSITLGEKDPEGGWADRLKRDFFAESIDSKSQLVSLYNLGVASETSDGLAARFKQELNARRIKGQRTIVILSYGINDIVIHKQKNLVPIPYFQKNLTQCIQFASKIGAETLLCSILPINKKLDGKTNCFGKLIYSRDIDLYNQRIEQIAKQINCGYIDNYRLFIDNELPTLLAADGIHPSSKGHQLIYQSVKSKLAELMNHNEQ